MSLYQAGKKLIKFMFEKYFSGIGIDFSEHHVRLAHVGSFGRIRTLKEIVIDDGIVVDEQIVDDVMLQKIVKKAVDEMGLSGHGLRTACLIPESRVFSHSFLQDVSLIKEDAKEDARAQAQKEIPLDFDRARVVISQGLRESGGTRTTVYASELSVVSKIENVFFGRDFHLMAIESNTKSIFRLFHGRRSLFIQKAVRVYFPAQLPTNSMDSKTHRMDVCLRKMWIFLLGLWRRLCYTFNQTRFLLAYSFLQERKLSQTGRKNS